MHTACKTDGHHDQHGHVQKPDGQPIGMSGGIAELQAESGKNWSDLVKLDDKRMYQVKINGKGRIVTE
jgi:GGDEF domain-containing protein